jgi:hypothetical protein
MYSQTKQVKYLNAEVGARPSAFLTAMTCPRLIHRSIKHRGTESLSSSISTILDINQSDSVLLTRKTKELDHEKLVTVILVPLSERHGE